MIELWTPELLDLAELGTDVRLGLTLENLGAAESRQLEIQHRAWQAWAARNGVAMPDDW